MKNKNGAGKSAILLFGIGMFFLALPVLAQTPPTSDKADAPEGVTVATVNIENSTFTVKEDFLTEISFELTNREGNQSGVKWGVELRSLKDGTLIDQLIYPESAFLKEHSSLKKTVSYTPPAYLAGTFGLWVVSRNEGGLLLGQMLVGEMTLVGNGRYLALQGCALKVGAEKTAYDLGQGVDVAPEEELFLVCAAENRTGAELSVAPHFQTNFRTVFGKKIAEADGAAIKLKKGETQELKLAVPKAAAPQAYDVTVTLQNSQGERVAGPVVAHYVLRGASATIQEAALDRDDYSQGDTAKLQLFWTGRADNFPEARQGMRREDKVLLKVATLQGSGQACGAALSKELDPARPNVEEKIAITADCANGKMVVTLTDEKGTVLDERTIAFKKKTGPIFVPEKWSFSLPQYVIVGGLFFLLALVAIIFKRKKNNQLPTSLLLFLSLSLLLSGQGVKADSWTGTQTTCGSWTCGESGSCWCDYDVNITSTYTVNFSDTTDICLDTSINITGSASSSACTNTNPSYYIERHMWDLNDYLLQGSATGAAVTKSYTAKTKTGTVSSWFRGAVFRSGFGADNKAQADHTINYTVKDCTPPTNGKCGTANGQILTSPPTTTRCAAGDARPVTTNVASSTYSWMCNGLNGGSNASCSANLQAPGACGTANGATFPTAPTANLCAVGSTPSSVTTVGAGYSWTCTGPNGGANVPCSANRPVAGACGTASGGTFTSPPTANLCSDEVNHSPVGTVGTNYSWICYGLNGGADTPCGANCDPGNLIYIPDPKEGSCPVTEECVSVPGTCSCIKQNNCGVQGADLPVDGKCADGTFCTAPAPKKCPCKNDDWIETN